MCFIGYCFFLQGLSSKLTELEEELVKANNDLEQEKATTLAQIEEIEALKKVSSKMKLNVKFLMLGEPRLLAPVTQMLDCAIHQIDHYPVDKF